MIRINEGFEGRHVQEIAAMAALPMMGADFDPDDAPELLDRVHHPNAYVLENVLARGLGFSGRGLEWLSEVALAMNDEAEDHEFEDFRAFQAEVVRRFVDKLAREVMSEAALLRVLPGEKFRQAAFIFHVCGRDTEELYDLLKKVRANRAAIDVDSVEAQVRDCIRMNTPYATVLRSDDAMDNFANGQRGVLAGLFGELKAIASLKPAALVRGSPAVSSVVFPAQEVDIALPLPGNKTALIEVAASIPKLLEKLGAGGGAQRAGYESIMEREPHRYVLGYSAGVNEHWFELFAGGDISPAARVRNAGRGLLVEGTYQDPAALKSLIDKARELQEALKIRSDALLTHRMKTRRILFKTFSAWDVRKLKTAL